MIKMLGVLLVWLALIPVAQASASVPLIAVAANFNPTVKQLQTRFAQKTGLQIRLVTGSSGQLFAQIMQGAPYAAFLSADTQKPTQLVKEGKAIKGTEFTYAVGQLALWTNDPALKANKTTLRHCRYLAIANPQYAPYGQAATQVLDKLGLAKTLQPRLVIAGNIAQAYQFVQTGSADLGFVAYSYIKQNPKIKPGSVWLIPADWHKPIRQNAVLIQDNPTARAFLAFLKTDEAKAIMQASGYH